MNTNETLLTQRQREVLEFVREWRSRKGKMPSTREIQRHFGFASQTAAVNHLKALGRKGFIRRMPGALLPVSESRFSEVPLLGAIPAGLPAYEEERSDGGVAIDLASIGVSESSRTFALTVRGDSMTGAHIQEGDVVVLEYREPLDGDVVAALIDGETTLKRFVLREGQPYLKAENAAYPDLLPVTELIVQGVVVALTRKVFR
ncbi:MAG: transcriptional repressor LexA [Opitutales bacterium]|nr:transcriptional repressor LexA [Opitutales bacterium]